MPVQPRNCLIQTPARSREPPARGPARPQRPLPLIDHGRCGQGARRPLAWKLTRGGPTGRGEPNPAGMNTARAQRSGRVYAARRGLAFWQPVFLCGGPGALSEAGLVCLGKSKHGFPVPDEPKLICFLNFLFFPFPKFGPRFHSYPFFTQLGTGISDVSVTRLAGKPNIPK